MSLCTHNLDTLAPTDEGEVPTVIPRAVRELSELSDRDTFRVTHKVIVPLHARTFVSVNMQAH